MVEAAHNISTKPETRTSRSDCLIGTVALRERGWTPGLIDRFLGDPDKLMRNPHYRSGAPMRLYALDRAVAAEGLPEFVQAQVTAALRSAAACKGAQAQRETLLAQVSQMQVTVRALDASTLLKRAISRYNKRLIATDRWDFTPASEGSDQTFLDRIQVNYVRHNLTDYDDELERVAGRVGVTDAVRAIRRKVYDAISAAYPRFSVECRNQLVRRYGEDTV